jgi:hypothetical protein
MPQFRECYLSVKNYKSTIPPQRMVKTLPPNSSLPLVTLNRPDIHQEIVNDYIKYSEAYWIGVRRRQHAYIDDKKYVEFLKNQEQQVAAAVPVILPKKRASYYIEPYTPSRAAVPEVTSVSQPEPVKNSFYRKLSSCYKV